MKDEKIHRLWKPITFEDAWRSADTSILDDLSSAWFARRARLRLDSKAYVDFLERLKREHAIETGVVERLYDISRGVTETLIQHGFVEGFLSHGDANIPSDQLMRHLNDHMEAMDFVFDLIKENRPLTTGFIKELHQLVTRHQHGAEGRDSQGNRTKIPLLKGTYKEWENNPARSDGTVIMYCPPVQVASEMDLLVDIYHSLEEEKIHPLIIAAWVHHAFTTIHPFQDGNGRVIRLVASLILIKHNLFPITVLREEAKVKYILALEKADAGMPSYLVSYFAVIQKRQIEKALNLGEVVSESLEEVERLLALRIKSAQAKLEGERDYLAARNKLIEKNRESIFAFVSDSMEIIGIRLDKSLGENSAVIVDPVHGFDDRMSLDDLGVAKYAEMHQQLANPEAPAGLIRMRIAPVGLSFSFWIWVVLYEARVGEGVFVIGFYFRQIHDEKREAQVPMHFEIPPHVMSILEEDISPRKKNISHFLEESLALALAEMYNQLN